MAVPGEELSDADMLILEAAIGARQLTEEELRQVAEHVAQAGFPPTIGRATGLAGLTWEGRILRGSDELTAAERHYLRHVINVNEWPEGTTLEEYVGSISQVVMDGHTGIFTSRYQGQWQIGFVRRSGDLLGPSGSEWVLVEYRLDIGHWVTAYQPVEGLGVIEGPGRENIGWQRRPQ